MRYDLEWDDFISWKNDNPNLEEVRDRLGAFEIHLFSKNPIDKLIYATKVIEERNKAAALIGLAPRERLEAWRG